MKRHTDEKAHELIGELIESADTEDLSSDDGELLLRWLECRTEWRPVTWNDYLPEEGSPVLCFHPDWGIAMGARHGAHFVGGWAGDVPATHWMPLPDPPRR